MTVTLNIYIYTFWFLCLLVVTALFLIKACLRLVAVAQNRDEQLSVDVKKLSSSHDRDSELDKAGLTIADIGFEGLLGFNPKQQKTATVAVCPYC